MRNFYLSIVLGFTISISGYGQKSDFNEKDFFNSLNSSYYTLSDQKIQNFAAFVTSLKFQVFADSMWKNQEIFPLQLIWFNPDDVYLSQLGVPKIESDKYKEYQEILDGLKLQLRGILLDLQRFYLNGLYKTISGDYKIQNNEEAVQITIRSETNNIVTKVKYLFGYNGLCLLNEISYPNQKKVIVIYPRFKTVKNKWLCQGWRVQTFVNGSVESGFELELTNSFIYNKWVPSNIKIEVQKAEKKGTTFYDEISIKNYLFDQPLELKGKAASKQKQP